MTTGTARRRLQAAGWLLVVGALGTDVTVGAIRMTVVREWILTWVPAQG